MKICKHAHVLIRERNGSTKACSFLQVAWWKAVRETALPSDEEWLQEHLFPAAHGVSLSFLLGQSIAMRTHPLKELNDESYVAKRNSG